MGKQEMENDNSLEWEVNSTKLKITESQVVLLPVSKLSPHPDNRPLGPSDEKIKQLKILIANDGYDASHPIVVRPYSNGYQIIEGEHRFTAAKSLGYLKLPCVIRELADTEALIQLVLGNIQSETKPLEIGINALKVVQKDSKKGYSASAYAQRLGIAESSVRRYMNASEVFQYIQTQIPEGIDILEEVYKLEEIHRCPQADWLWLHDLVIKNSLSQKQVIEIIQAIRDIKTENPAVYTLFDFMLIKQEIAQNILKGNPQIAETYKDLIQTIEISHQNLDEQMQAHEYNVLLDIIQSETVNLKEWFISNLKALKNISKQAVLEAYKDALQLKRGGSKEEAERTANYFRDKKNSKEREEQERLEKQMRQVKAGEWWQLGSHFLYCGDGSDINFFNKLPQNIAFSYCKPPFITEIAQADNQTTWILDKLIQKAEIVAVTPEIDQIQQLLKISKMPYRWAMSAHLNLKKSDAGLGNWIFTALFSQKNMDTKVKDTWRIDNSDLQGSKSIDFLKHLIESFSKTHDIVADLYGGLGEMLLLAEKLGRVCYLAEVNPVFCKEILEKWEELAKAKAFRLA